MIGKRRGLNKGYRGKKKKKTNKGFSSVTPTRKSNAAVGKILTKEV